MISSEVEIFMDIYTLLDLAHASDDRARLLLSNLGYVPNLICKKVFERLYYPLYG